LLLSGLSVGSTVEIPGDALQKALRALWRQNIFDDISIETENITGNKLFLLIRVVERPRISKYTFSGITKSQAEDLREQVNLVRGQRLTEAKKRRVEQVVKNYYAEKGFLNTTVEIVTDVDPQAPSGQIVTVKIAKGKRVKVQDIQFIGIAQLEENKLLKKLKNTKEQRWYRIWKRSKYIPALWLEDTEALKGYMASLGYRDARIERDTVLNVSSNRVSVQVNVHEGNRFFIRGINFEGNFTHTDGRLDSMMNIRSGDVYNTQLLEQRLQMDPSGTDISSLYLDDGYLFFTANPVEVAVNGDSVDLEIRIYEGPRARYRNIYIEGNDKTSDHVVLRSVRTYPGNYFSRAEIIRSQREIVSLGYFNQENMNIVPVPNPEDGTVDIRYIVEEKPSDQLFFQGGWGGRIRDSQGRLINNGLVATVGLRFNNFSTRKLFQRRAWRPLPSGDGQMLSIQAQLNGRNFQNYSVSFLEPWLGGRKPNSLGVTVFHSRQNYLFQGAALNTVGATVDFGTRLRWPDDFFRYTVSFGYKYYDLKNSFRIFGSENYVTPRGVINSFTFRQVIERNSTDAPIYSTSGSLVSLSLEATPPYSLFSPDRDYRTEGDNTHYKFLEFHKWKFMAQSFMRLFGNTVLVPRVMFGYLGQFSQRYGPSPMERFYLGGEGILGFQLDGREILPLRGYPNVSIGDRTNGNLGYIKYTLELASRSRCNRLPPFGCWAFWRPATPGTTPRTSTRLTCTAQRAWGCAYSCPFLAYLA
jgi:outer membrane protein insertion porin family